jgi:KDO2-lipid IV(A) lauroyltransferase
LAAFPDLDEDAADAVIRGCWENLGQGFAEFPHLPKLSDEELLTYMTCDGLEHLRDSQKLGKGAVLATAHYGVWELGAKFWPYAVCNAC